MNRKWSENIFSFSRHLQLREKHKENDWNVKDNEKKKREKKENDGRKNE